MVRFSTRAGVSGWRGRWSASRGRAAYPGFAPGRSRTVGRWLVAGLEAGRDVDTGHTGQGAEDGPLPVGARRLLARRTR
jgi:hypothetical protein